jgi:ribulose 1,5-bisphosphate carboxylase large subunit-like protein
MGLGAFEEFVGHLQGACPVITSNLGSGILTRPRISAGGGKSTGLSEAVLVKFSRLAGADGVHTGTSNSECYGREAWTPATRALRGQLFAEERPSLAVAEGDLTIANLWDNIRDLGMDTLIEPTSGILSFPGGPGAGAKAFRTLLDCLRADMSEEEAQRAIKTASGKSKPLRIGFDHFHGKRGANDRR